MLGHQPVRGTESRRLSDDRPSAPITQIPIHEFLKCWTSEKDPAFRSWVQWFTANRIKFIVGRQWMTIHGRTGEFVMIYTHRLSTRHGGDIRQSRWCCDE